MRRAALPVLLLLASALGAGVAFARPADADLLLGEFEIDGANAVVDGDTLRVPGLKKSVRILALDAEETHFAGGRGLNRKRPTGLGEEARQWAQDFLGDVRRVRLERDHPDEDEDRFGRPLAYAFVFKDGVWRNFSVEAVRAGMSAYFTKYGRSRRFDAELKLAQREARQAQRGIWRPGADAYADYPARLQAWETRAALIAAFDRDVERDPRHVSLTRVHARRM